MADARLDLEVVISGTGKAAKGLDDIRDSSALVRKHAGELSSAFGGLVRGASAANAAQAAMAQLMAGNFVGAFRSATVAVRGLWTAMMSNPYTLVAAAIATAISSLVLWKRHVDDVKRSQDEASRSMRNFVDDLNRARGSGPLDIISKQISDAEKSGDVNSLIAGRDEQAKKEEYLFNRARILGSSVAGGNEEDRGRAEDARRAWMDAKDALGLYNEALLRIQEDDGLSPVARSETSASGNQSGVPESEADPWAGWRARFKDYVREKRLAKISDPMQRLNAELKLLENDLASTTGRDLDSLTRRLDLREKILRIEMRISAEQASGHNKSVGFDKDAAAADEADRQRKIEEHRAIEGHTRTDGFVGAEAPEGFLLKEKSRFKRLGRQGAENNVIDRFNADRMRRFAAGGVDLARTTKMGRPDIGPDGKANPAERTNKLLEDIKGLLG